MGASSRLRLIQFYPFFKKLSILYYFSFSNDYYLRLVYKKKFIIKYLLLIYFILKRLSILSYFCIKKNNIIIFEKDLIPYCCYELEKFFIFLLKYNNNILIADIDDGLFYRYNKNIFTKNKLENLYKNVNSICCGSSTLKSWANRYCQSTYYIQTTSKLNDQKNFIKSNPHYLKKDKSKFKLGWIGTPITERYLDIVFAKYSDYLNENIISLHIMGSNKHHNLRNVYNYDWSEENEIKFLNELNVGLMPLHNSPYEYYKCSFKIIQYMAFGIFSIASKIGNNLNVLNNPNVGHLVHDDNWEKPLNDIIKENIVINKDLIRKHYEKNYSYKNAVRNWKQLLSNYV